MTDIRKTRTDRMLCEAMEALLDEKPYNVISVSEICKRSTVQRGTFYRHFEDKNAFFEYYLNTITEQLLSEAEAEGEDLDALEPYARTMHPAADEAVQGETALGAQLVGVGRFGVHRGHGRRSNRQRHRRAGRRQVEESGRQLFMPPEFLGRFYAGGMIHVLRWWLLESPHVTEEELERYSNNVLLRCFE